MADQSDKLLAMRIVLEVDGMMCMKNCGTTVQNALRSVDGVEAAVVDYDEHIAVVTMAPNGSPDDLVEMLDMVGFEAVIRDEMPLPRNVIRLGIDGMMCMKNCGTTVQNALSATIGVESAIVDYPKAMATITLYPDHIDHVTVQDLIDEVECVGFDAYPFNHGERCRRRLAAKANAAALHAVEDVAVAIEGDSSHPHAIFSIEGMSCAACVKGIEGALRDEPGIIDIRVGLISAKAEVVFDRSIITDERTTIGNFIRDAGYTPTYINTLDADDDSMSFKYAVAGVTGASDAIKIESSITALVGVVSATVDVEQQVATVHLQQMAATGPRDVLDAITKSGFAATIQTQSSAPSGVSEDQKWLRLLLICLVFSGPAMVVHMVLGNIPSCRMWLMQTIVNGPHAHVPDHVFARDAGAVWHWRALLQGRVQGPAARHDGHGLSHRRGHHRLVPLQLCVDGRLHALAQLPRPLLFRVVDDAHIVHHDWPSTSSRAPRRTQRRR